MSQNPLLDWSATSPPPPSPSTKAPIPGAQGKRGWSLRIGRLAGVDVYVHTTFLLLLGWIVLSHLLQGDDLWATAGGLLLVLLTFGVVVLHELGHALCARRFGIRTLDILLLPIGGIARLERMPDKPSQELLVALAGPAVNMVLALFFYALLTLAQAPLAAAGLTLTGSALLSRLMWLNISLALFNLLPAFPMDGGRVLRAALASRMNPARATQLAARIGQGMAVLLGLVGILVSPFLVFIALFVWMGAAEEATLAAVRSELRAIPVWQAMITEFAVVDAAETADRALERTLAGFQEDFPVVDEGEIVGVLTRDDLLRGLCEQGPSAAIAALMERHFVTAEATESLDDAVTRMETNRRRFLPVSHRGRLVGILTLEHVAELLATRHALSRSIPPPSQRHATA
jgi:Zn-dependent protease/CBS domain-containing protein